MNNHFAMGINEYTGQFKKVRGTGMIKIYDSNIEDLFVSGVIDITNTRINKSKLVGEVCAKKVEFENVEIIGNFAGMGICKAKIMHVAGNLNVEILDTVIICDSKHMKKEANNNIKWSGIIKAVTFESYNDFTIKSNYIFKNIINVNKLLSGDRIFCDNLFSFDIIKTECINADNVYITAIKGSDIRQIEGGKVVIGKELIQNESIRDIPKTIDISKIKKMKSNEKIEVYFIEADEVDVDYLKAIKICGKTVSIGDNCIVDTVEYSKELILGKNAIVKKVTRL